MAVVVNKLLVSFLIISSCAVISTYADPYDSPSPPKTAIPSPPPPPPPSAVAGKEFPPTQSISCNVQGTKCFDLNISCPSECPSFKPANPNAKACTIDCNSPKCEAFCHNRTANCNGKGSACGDPRFVGGDGIVFYFHGKSNQHFALVSDQNLQINARFIGHRPQGRKRDNTWIKALGLMFNNHDHPHQHQHHTFTLAATPKVAQWDDSFDWLQFTYDEKPVVISEGHLSSWSSGDLVVERTAKRNSVTVTLPGVVEISARVVPITEEDDRIHNYQLALADDCFAHLEVQLRFFGLSERVEGVLGQTYRPDFQNPVKRGVAMPVMGGEHKYLASSLTSADCQLCTFSLPRDQFSSVATNTMECNSKISNNGRGIVCRR